MLHILKVVEIGETYLSRWVTFKIIMVFVLVTKDPQLDIEPGTLRQMPWQSATASLHYILECCISFVKLS